MGEPITVPLFQSAHDGFGDERLIRPNRYHRVHGSVDMRWPQQARLGLIIRSVNDNDHSSVPVFAAEWEDTSGNPRLYYLVGTAIRYLQDGSNTAVSTALAQTATDGMIDDDGSGVPYLYIAEGTAGNIERMNRAETVTTASGSLLAQRLMSLNGRAYRTITPTSGTANCQISNCPPGSDRFTAANWSAGQTVGFAGTEINALISIRQAAVAVKPEGIFAYSEQLDRWVNYTRSWESNPHPDNGLGSYSIGDLAIVPMGDGGVILFDGFTARPIDPLSLNSSPGLHTTSGCVNRLGASRHWVVATTLGNCKMISAGDSLEVRHYDNATTTYTDISANLRDTNRDTNSGSLTIDETTDAIFIGWRHPISAVKIDMGTVNAVSRTMTAAVSTASGSPNTYTTVAHRDFTDSSGAPLGQDGTICFTADPVNAGWVQVTEDGSEQYWMRLTFDGALTDPITIVGMQIQPWYPSVDVDTFPLDGLDRSGVFPHILFGRPSGGGDTPWHDMGSLPEPDEIGAVLVSDIGGSNKNRFRQLVLVGRFETWTMDIVPDDHPSTVASPFTHNTGLWEGSAFYPGQGRVAKLLRVRMNGQEFDAATSPGYFYYTWDYGKPWSRLGSRVLRLPAEIQASGRESSQGVLFRWCFGWRNTGASYPPSQPQVNVIEADFEVMPEVKVDSVQERPMATRTRF